MALEKQASDDFERALHKGFWRRILTRLTGETNELLPFDEVRAILPLHGQHYAGLKQVAIDQIVGSEGRYHDFDRAFLPLQSITKDRWISIDKAHYEDVILPPVDLYKIGEAYFVKDGNHRVSVARQRGQVFVDAYVTEIDAPVTVTPQSDLQEIAIQVERSQFLEQTGLAEQFPDLQIESKVPGQYARLLEHISVHRWYLGMERNAEVPMAEASVSWYEQVYQPLVAIIRENKLMNRFPGSSEADLYLWVMEYQGYLREAYREEKSEELPMPGDEQAAQQEAARLVTEEYPLPLVRRLVSMLQRESWLVTQMLQRERQTFLELTRLAELRPEVEIELTLPGQYPRLLNHIAAHRYYLGEQRHQEIPYPEAVISWVDNVYLPLVKIIREQNILSQFPGRSEADLYLWIIRHQWSLQQEFGGEVPMKQAAEQFTEEHTQRPVKKIVKAVKKAAGLEKAGEDSPQDE